MKRIELELRKDTCGRLDYSIVEILDNKNNVLGRLFAKYFNKFSDFELPLDIALLPYSQTESSLRESFLSLGHIPDRYLAQANGFIKNICENTGYK
jgi:hypothetical protein